MPFVPPARTAASQASEVASCSSQDMFCAAKSKPKSSPVPSSSAVADQSVPDQDNQVGEDEDMALATSPNFFTPDSQKKNKVADDDDPKKSVKAILGDDDGKDDEDAMEVSLSVIPASSVDVAGDMCTQDGAFVLDVLDDRKEHEDIVMPDIRDVTYDESVPGSASQALSDYLEALDKARSAKAAMETARGNNGEDTASGSTQETKKPIAEGESSTAEAKETTGEEEKEDQGLCSQSYFDESTAAKVAAGDAATEVSPKPAPPPPSDETVRTEAALCSQSYFDETAAAVPAPEKEEEIASVAPSKPSKPVQKKRTDAKGDDPLEDCFKAVLNKERKEERIRKKRKREETEAKKELKKSKAEEKEAKAKNKKDRKGAKAGRGIKKKNNLQSPFDGLSTKERIRRLQQMRTAGTWVECCHKACGKWRYLPKVLDPSVLPSFWTCEQAGPSVNCDTPQEPWSSADETAFVQCEFTVGSVVWARLGGFPWWPALVDDDPDTETFFWTDEDSDVVTWYHVVFFDRLSKSVARAWIRSKQIRRFDGGDDGVTSQQHHPTSSQSSSARPPSRAQVMASVADNSVATKKSLAEAEAEALNATEMPLQDRRKKYCFLSRYKGKWGLPWDLDLGRTEEDSNEEEEA